METHRTLVEVLPETLGLTGTKKSCNEGECRACAVLIDGQPAAFCLVLAVQAQGKEITTTEGPTEGTKLHRLQEAFVKGAAIQCGFCRPGMIMAAKAFPDEHPATTPAGVRKAISWNLCRCTDYRRIVDALIAASTALKRE